MAYRRSSHTLTAELARSLFRYAPETGLLSWAKPPRRGVSAGPAGCRIKCDDRWENLRPATFAQNNRNCDIRKDNKSGVRGVLVSKDGKFNPRITVDGKQIHLGYFDDIEPAALARRNAELKYFGEFSPLHRGEN
jgi:hypothetical protein